MSAGVRTLSGVCGRQWAEATPAYEQLRGGRQEAGREAGERAVRQRT